MRFFLTIESRCCLPCQQNFVLKILHKAAKIDGANTVQTFSKITLPYMLYITTPYLIATFTGNVNNFNIIYLLSGGDPVTDLASTAGSTDLLVTWLYVFLEEVWPVMKQIMMHRAAAGDL